MSWSPEAIWLAGLIVGLVLGVILGLAIAFASIRAERVSADDRRH